MATDAHLLERAREGDAVALARALVAIPSVNPTLAEGTGEAEIADFAAGLLTQWGLDVIVSEPAPGRCNVVATASGTGPTLLLNGHLDTVGVEGMTVPAFGAEVRDGKLSGRGACDMKGGVAALLAAARRLVAEGERPNLIVALTADEEHASIGMEALVSNGVRADFAVVCEPTGLSVMTAHKGFVWARLRFRGRAAHGSRPDLGVDAIRHAGLYLAELEGYVADLNARPGHPLLGTGSVHAGLIRGGTAESVYPELCELVLERRTLPGESPDAVMEELEDIVARLAEREPSLAVSAERTLERPGTEVSPESPYVRALLRAIEARGLTPEVDGMSAWVDAAFLNQAGIPAVCFGPGDMGKAHSADEWIATDQIAAASDVLEAFARSLAQAAPGGVSAAGS